MVWSANFSESLGPMITLQGTITADEFETILQDQRDPHYVPKVQIDKALIHITTQIEKWFHEHQDEKHHLILMESSRAKTDVL